MKIKEINIKNLLSFSEVGFNLESEPLKFLDFNLIIGKNNSGKTNILKLFKLLTIMFSTKKPSIHLYKEQYIPLSNNKDINLDNWFYEQDINKNVEFSVLISIEKADDVSIIKQMRTKLGAPDSGNPFLEFYKKALYPKLIKIFGKIIAKEHQNGIPSYLLGYNRLEIIIDERKENSSLTIYDLNNFEIWGKT